jgi:RNA polymerase sigma-70 factor (ECF subfamily)
MEGDDLFQEAVVRAFEKLHSLRDETRFRAWFYAVLLSLHRSRSRWGFWRRFLPLEPVLATAMEPAGEDGRLREEQSMKAERVSRALTRLPAVQREAVVLHDIDGYKMEEIADMQGVTVSAVKSRVARGRQRLRAHYESSGIRVAPEPEEQTEEQTEDARFAISNREQTAS